jgi:phosphoinositide-3-kinase regulatory subunit 4
MGQGYSITTLSAGSAGIDVPEMADLTYEKSLGNARFMKTIRARHKEGLVVVKVVMKPYSTFRLDKYVKILLAERKALLEIPNTLGYYRIVETSTNGYMVRQYINGSLYDRMSTRPFLEDIEKKWIAFQLLCAVRDCHARDIFHGDIKTENILVTSWNWLYLSDFSSSFKPTYLPEDNPADFSFFFDTSGRRTCYLAPERFLNPGEDAAGKSPINWAMDIFSVGCVIAELFLETPIFTLSTLFKYRANREYNPALGPLKRIADKDIREMVTHMISLDPEGRYSAEEYLRFWKDKAFPGYFYNFLHQYMHLITDPSSGRSPLTSGKENLGEADERVDRLYNDFDKISYFLGYDGPKRNLDNAAKVTSAYNQLFPLQIDIAGNRHTASTETKSPLDDGTLLFLTIVVGCLKTTARTNARLKACDLLLAFAERLTDEAKLDRILPYLMSMLHDKSDVVKVAALRTVTQVLALVTVVSPTNSYIFPEYLFPRFQYFVSNSENRPSAWVRSTYASCLGSLATTAARFLDMNQALNVRGPWPTSDPEVEEGTVSRSTYQNLFDSAREDIITQFEMHTTALLTDNDASVRRSLLPSVGTLCVFFGSQRASDVILSHLNTYLNDRDWQLKKAFFETIVGVTAYVGTAGLEEFILPLMVPALTDSEECVVERVIRSFSSIADLGLFQRPVLWELLSIVVRFTMHPNQWIRESAAQFVAAAGKLASTADLYGIILPTIRPYLKVTPRVLSELALLDALKEPLTRIVLELSATWAKKSEKTQFWKNFHKQRVFSFEFGDNLQLASPNTKRSVNLQKLPRSPEDEQWLQRLRNAGLTTGDDFKLVALQEYIWRSANRKLQEDHETENSPFNAIVKMNDLNVELQNVFFDNDKASMQAAAYDLETRTIAEAMQDATSSSMAPPERPDTSIYEGPSSPQEIPQTSHLTTGGSPLQEPSSFDSRRSFRIGEHSIQRKNSAISLMGRRDVGGKAAAEISTDTTNAFGQVERTFSQEGKLKKRATTASATSEGHINIGGRKILPVHSYPGNDPNVLRLLDSLYLESYPVDLIEFGPIVTPTRGEPLQRSGVHHGSWRPEGVLVAMLCEHTAAINRVATAPDHKFFITGSDDGTVKVWDVGRLERNVTHRSRHTHFQGTKVKVTSLCFVENTYCFVSTGSDGSVHVVKVECLEQANTNMTRYGRMSTVRQYQLPAGEFAVWSQHQKVENQSILILATNQSRVYGIEMRTMNVVWKIQNPHRNGTINCFCVDKKNHWLLLGTSQGILDLWDLRWKTHSRSWGFSGGTPIRRLHNQSYKGSKRYRVLICGGAPGEIMTFDVEKGQIKDMFKTSIAAYREAALKSASVVPIIEDLDRDANRPGGVLSRFVPSSPMETVSSGSDKSVRAVAVGTQGPPESSDAKHTFMLTAGPDWKVRFWDSLHHNRCMVVNGLEYDEAPPTYSYGIHNGVGITTEKTGVAPSDLNSTSRGSGSSTPAGTPSKKGKSSRSAIVSMQQQSLLRGHNDVIMDIALLEAPYGMVVSVDRAGVIYVFS